jgi:acetyltransferase-like isoleucine patch superfamily enzyme
VIPQRFTGLPSGGTAATASFVLRVARMAARGALRKPTLGTSGGPLFIGRGVRISNASHIHHRGRLVIEDGAEVQGLSSRGLVLGAEVSIGARCMIRPSSYYGGEVGEGLRMGDRSSMASGCFIGCSGFIEIGDDVMLGPGVRLFAENHVFDDRSRTIKSQGVRRGTVVIGDDCWLGSGAMVMSDVKIGAGVVVAAGSIVTEDVPDGVVVAGTPARIIRER